jgi:hypothetical protein
MNRPLPSLLTSLAISLALALALAFALAFGLAMAAPALPALAEQQTQPPPAQPPAPEKEKPENKKPKKVWTNDGLEGLSGTSGVSVVGGTSAARGAEKPATKPAGYAREKDPNWYRAELAPLRAELDRLDKEITQTREFINGGHTAEGKLKVNVFSVPMNPADHIAQLEKRKAEVQSKIDALEDLARRNDIPPGAFR